MSNWLQIKSLITRCPLIPITDQGSGALQPEVEKKIQPMVEASSFKLQALVWTQLSSTV